jgi:hypothetical protein
VVVPSDGIPSLSLPLYVIYTPLLAAVVAIKKEEWGSVGGEAG